MFINLMYLIVCCLNSRALFGVSTFQGLVSVSGRSTLNNFHVSQTLRQGLSQDLETGCPKMAIVNFFGVQILRGPQFTQISTINMYTFILIRLDIRNQSHGNHMDLKKIQSYVSD